MIIDCISDLHGHYPKLGGGDLLIVAGDLTAKDTREEFKAFNLWLDGLNYRKKVFIAGNHDNFLQESMAGMVGTTGMFSTDKEKVFLCDSGIEFFYEEEWPEEINEDFLLPLKRTLKIWGSPWTRTFPGMNPKCKAFTVDTEEQLAEKWALIPDDIDILVTHEAPMGIGDIVVKGDKRVSVGSSSLLYRVRNSIIGLHVYGHIHEGYGQYWLCQSKFVNASLVNEYYRPVNEPIRIEL